MQLSDGLVEVPGHWWGTMATGAAAIGLVWLVARGPGGEGGDGLPGRHHHERARWLTPSRRTERRMCCATFCTHLADAGADVGTIRELAGHAEIAPPPSTPPSATPASNTRFADRAPALRRRSRRGPGAQELPFPRYVPSRRPDPAVKRRWSGRGGKQLGANRGVRAPNSSRHRCAALRAAPARGTAQAAGRRRAPPGRDRGQRRRARPAGLVASW